MSFETISSEVVFQGKAFNVHSDQVRLPDGQVVRMDIVEHVGAVTILPLDEDGQIWFVRQYRHATGKALLELPAGMLEPGEQPEACARREIREETGMAAGQIEKLGELYLAPGYSTEYMHVFLAQDLYPSPLPGDQDEFLSVEKISFKQAFELVKRGELQDAKSLAALLLANQKRTWI